MSNPNNKWTRPNAPPAPMFFGAKERNLVKQINDELAERVLGQTIAYYPISIAESNFNDTYGEAVEKVSLPPVRVFAYVIVESEQTNERYGYEYQSKLTVNFHRRRLVEDQDLYVRVGDFIQYGELFYEIVRTYNDTRYLFGQVEHKFQIAAECVRAREGSFRVTPSIDRPDERALVAGEGTSPAPRDVPYPPLEASYITVSTERKLPNERVLTAGTGITLVDTGAGGTITVNAAGANAQGAEGALQLQAGAGVFGASSNLVFLTGSNRLGIGTDAPTHSLTIVGNMSASSDLLVGGDLQVAGMLIGGSPLKISGSIQIVEGGETIMSLGDVAGDGTTALSASAITVSGDLDVGENISGSFYYRDGRHLTNITASAVNVADGPEYSIQFRYDSPIGGEISGSSNLLFITSSNTLSVTGDVSASANISASAFYGDGSNLTGVSSNATAKGIAGSLQFKTGSAEMTGSSAVVYDLDNNRLTVAGGLIHNRTAVTTSHTASVSDYILGATAVPSEILADATLFANGQVLLVKDESGAASSAQTVALMASGSQTIDGQSSLSIEAPHGSVLVYSDGSNWFVY